MSLGEVGEADQNRIVRVALQLNRIPHNTSLQAQVLLDGNLEALANFLATAVHRQRRHLVAQTDIEMAALAGLEGAALFGEPPLELSGCHNTNMGTKQLNATDMLRVVARSSEAVNRR